MRMRLLMLAMPLAMIAGVVSASGQDATLRYRWVKGDETRYRFSQQASTTMSGLPGPGEITIGQTMVQVVRNTVQDVTADNTAIVRQTFESIRLEANSPAGSTVFDSTAPGKPSDPGMATVAAMMSAMVGESITLAIAPSGTILRVEGMTAIFDKAMKALPPQGPAMAPVFDQLKRSLNDDAFRSMFEQGFGFFPERSLKVGDTWTSQSDVMNPLLGKTTAVRTYRLDRIESREGASLAHIAVTLAMKQTGPAAAVIPGINAAMEDGTSTGEIVFDATKGRVQRTTFNSETRMNLSIAPPGADPVSAKGVVRTTLTMELVEK